MKNIKLVFLSLMIVGMLSISVFAQNNSSVDRINDIPVNQLYRGNIQLPSDFPVTSVKFFNIITESLTQVTVNLMDENQVIQWKVTINYNTVDKIVEYKIFDNNSNMQWVKVSYSFVNGKDIADGISSSNKTMKVMTLRGQATSDCNLKVPVSDIEIIVNNQDPKKILETEFQTQKGKAYLPLLIQETEEIFYNTSQLKVLQNVLLFIDRLQGMVMEKSLGENSNQAIEGVPKCNVFCLRVGTLVPIYACNDYLLNCRRCGVNGVYLLGGFGCFAVCSIPCSSFFVWG